MLSLYAMQCMFVESIIDLLNSKIGLSLSSKNFGILSKSTSRPTHKNDLFDLI